MTGCEHHWHEPRDPLRMRRQGFRQVRCCVCRVRGWAKLDAPLVATCGREGRPVKVDEVEVIEPKRNARTGEVEFDPTQPEAPWL